MRPIRSTPLRLTVILISVFTVFLTAGLGRANEIAAATDTRVLMLRLSLDGQTISTLPQDAPIQGIVSHHDLAIGDPAESYLARTEPIGTGTVTVLLTRESVSELNETFMAILGFSFLPIPWENTRSRAQNIDA